MSEVAPDEWMRLAAEEMLQQAQRNEVVTAFARAFIRRMEAFGIVIDFENVRDQFGDRRDEPGAALFAALVVTEHGQMRIKTALGEFGGTPH